MSKKIISTESTRKKPVSVVTEISQSTAQELLALQIDYMIKQLHYGLLKIKVLNQLESLRDSIKDKNKYYEEFGNKLCEIRGQEIVSLKIYKEKLISIVENNVTEVPLVSVSYKVTHGNQLSVVNVEPCTNVLNHWSKKRKAFVYSGERYA